MRHVFVETNWVVACSAPAHNKTPAALELLERAAAEELTLHLPAICISEARRPLLERFAPRNEADRVRQYLLWAREQNFVDRADEEAARRVLDQMEGRVKADIAKIDETLRDLSARKGVQLFDLTQPMYKLCAELSHAKLNLEPFDQAILAAILVRAEELAADQIKDTDFCELDAHLQPWDKDSRPKNPLAELYEERRIWVYADFLLQAPEKPAGWPPFP